MDDARSLHDRLVRILHQARHLLLDEDIMCRGLTRGMVAANAMIHGAINALELEEDDIRHGRTPPRSIDDKWKDPRIVAIEALEAKLAGIESGATPPWRMTDDEHEQMVDRAAAAYIDAQLQDHEAIVNMKGLRAALAMAAPVLEARALERAADIAGRWAGERYAESEKLLASVSPAEVEDGEWVEHAGNAARSVEMLIRASVRASVRALQPPATATPSPTTSRMGWPTGCRIYPTACITPEKCAREGACCAGEVDASPPTTGVGPRASAFLVQAEACPCGDSGRPGHPFGHCGQKRAPPVEAKGAACETWCGTLPGDDMPAPLIFAHTLCARMFCSPACREKHQCSPAPTGEP